MALNKVILDKINQEIEAAKGNVNALELALLRRDLYNALEKQGENIQTVEKFDEIFDRYQHGENVLYTSPITQEQNQKSDKKNNDVAVVAAFANKVAQVFEKHQKAIDSMLDKHNVYSKDPELRKVQQNAHDDNFAYVMNEEQSKAQDKLYKIIDTVIESSAPAKSDDEVKSRATKSNIVKLSFKPTVNTIALNPEALTEDLLEDFRKVTSFVRDDVADLYAELTSTMTPAQQALFARMAPLFGAAISSSNTSSLNATGFKNKLVQQDTGAAEYVHKKPYLQATQFSKPEPAQSFPADLNPPRAPGVRVK
jgi:hypothetical protein